MHLRRTVSTDLDFCRLVELLDKDLWRRYPDTQQYFHGYNAVKTDARVVVAYLEDEAVGCGCFRETGREGAVEIKRMYVKEEARGRGIAGRILQTFEGWALEEGKEQAILETMVNQPEAISVYKKAGYIEIEKYEPYTDSKDSVCMGKAIITAFE